MDLSGIIFVVLAVAWAVYLVPKAVKHHDEAAPARSVDRFSTAMRVLARPASEESPAEPTTRPRRQSPAVRRAAARAAARRRRRVLSVLLMADVTVGALVAFVVVPWWSVLVPVALTLAFLVLCRRQVRRENEALWGSDLRSDASRTTPPRRAVRVDSAYGSALATDAADSQDAEQPFQIPVTDTEAEPVVVETADGGSLWDPLPVTLPTYVTKARAERTVRTIDLGSPGSWTSGRDEADSALVAESTTETVDEAVEHEPRRAVGS